MADLSVTFLPLNIIPGSDPQRGVLFPYTFRLSILSIPRLLIAMAIPPE